MHAEGIRQKKTGLQNLIKQNSIDACTIQETHLAVNHRFYVRGYETHKQDREGRSKGGVVTLVRNAIPSIEIQRSTAGDTEFLGVELVLTDHHLHVFNIYPLPTPTPPPPHPDKPIALHLIDRLVGLVVKASATRAEGPGFDPRPAVIHVNQKTPESIFTRAPSWNYEKAH